MLRLVTGNLFSDESTSEPGTLPMRYSISHTECRAIADVIALVRHRLELHRSLQLHHSLSSCTALSGCTAVSGCTALSTRGLATAFTCVLTAFRGGAGASTA